MVVESFKFVKTGLPRFEVQTNTGHVVHVSFERGSEHQRAVEPASVQMVTRGAYLMPREQHAILSHLMENHATKTTLPAGFLAALRLAHEQSEKTLQRTERKVA